MVEGNVAAFTVRRRCRFRSTKNDTELLLVQRFVLEVCSSSVESSEFNSTWSTEKYPSTKSRESSGSDI